MQEIQALQAQVFGRLFQLSNQLQVLGDRALAPEGLTTKQWFCIVAVQQFGNHIPTLSEAASLMGVSRQNVKQLALKLSARGFLRIEADTQDSRVSRLRLTDACHAFWQNRRTEDDAFIAQIFAGISASQLQTVADCFDTLLKTIEEGITPA